MRKALGSIVASALAALVIASDVGAVAGPGAVAPNFTKSQIDYPSFGLTTPRSLTDYLGKVVLIFELGYN